MKYTYLLINFLTIVFPVALSFDKRVAFHKSWKFIWPGMAITGLFFLVWDVLFTVKGVWSFNPKYILGINLFGLPVEEVLFFLTVPFACIFIYACLNHYLNYMLSDIVSEVLSSAFGILSILVLIFFYHKLYPLVTFSLLLVLIILFEYVLRRRWLNRFYIMYFVALIPFYVVNGALTSIPVVLYSKTQTMGTRVWTIPFEDHFYLMALLLMNIGFFEHFSKKGVANGE
ncbi:lycopene cyclase domain-containing protein [Mucilaginibacter sp. AW1-3]